ncbi:glutathione S-transferase family protein [Rhodovibrionaceae bacterium A322]
MLTLWGRPNSINVQKVMWTLAELDVPHKRIDAGGAFGGLDSPDFLAMNPNGRIPVLRDGEVVLWESNSIVRYLGTVYGKGKLQPEDPGQVARADQWMEWQTSTLYPPLRAAFVELIRTAAEDRDDMIVEAAEFDLAELWPLLDEELAGKSYVLGDELSLADMILGPTAYRYFNLDLYRPSLPHLEAWYDRLVARPAFREQVMIEIT